MQRYPNTPFGEFAPATARALQDAVGFLARLAKAGEYLAEREKARTPAGGIWTHELTVDGTPPLGYFMVDIQPPLFSINVINRGLFDVHFATSLSSGGWTRVAATDRLLVNYGEGLITRVYLRLVPGFPVGVSSAVQLTGSY